MSVGLFKFSIYQTPPSGVHAVPATAATRAGDSPRPNTLGQTRTSMTVRRASALHHQRPPRPGRLEHHALFFFLFFLEMFVTNYEYKEGK